MQRRTQSQRHSAQLPVNGTALRHGSTSFAPGNTVQNQHAQHVLSEMSTGLPPGSYINPAFQNILTVSSTNVYSNDNNAYSAQSSYSPAAGYPQRSATDHKRKLDVLRGSPPQQKRSKPPTAPSVPRFGSLSQSPRPTKPSPKSSTSRAKQSTNALGLTPQEGRLQYSSDSEPEEDGIDEEAMFAELGSNLTFEHNGAVLSLKTAADLAVWRAERARNFPTKARKAVKLEQKRQLGEERLRLLTEASGALRSKQSQMSQACGGPTTKSDRMSQAEKSQIENPVDEQGLSKTKLARSNSHPAVSDSTTTTTQHFNSTDNLDRSFYGLSKEAPVTASVFRVDEANAEPNDGLSKQPGNEDVGTTEAMEDSDKPCVSSDASSSVSSDCSSDPSADNGPPEETTSKVEKRTQVVRCRYFLASGHCRDGKSCRYKHDLPAGFRLRSPNPTVQQQSRDRHKPQLDSSTSARRSIHDRLLEQEQHKEEELGLRVIKYLGKVGLFARRQ
ncbi:hypothetical protein DOTSEDRAFT_49610 [Dothistroma septosporum NZE10]|uniref:C3H1-type domain-containing protein n=1 Tax=Dothistroma septosporum (strain NZE10 / CBS 128990) TaxID=675120 RepID=N1Q247_DOTSN|nr:hypothetical protein DOTSEDRAFT_49610 [Dothistroma septosporum NZE10]